MVKGFEDRDVVDPKADAVEKASGKFAADPHEMVGAGKKIAAKVLRAGKWRKIGLVADTHLCCREERLAELNAFYDILADEGIAHVFHAGNAVDGYIPRINGASVYESSIDGQTDYFVERYPARKGIVTSFITGDDHEGWWIKEGFNWGSYAEDRARKAGRTDLQYIGHVEADVTLRARDGSAVMKVQHPGGGSAYARSYTSQKQVEAFEGGEKPAILVRGHEHVGNFMFDRNIWVVNMPGFQDQTIFARKKRLRMEVGGAILSFMQQPDGSIHRLQIEFIRFFTRGYYREYLAGDRKVRREVEI